MSKAELGARSIDSRGYVTVKVESGHHLAQKRGWAYEHRLIAEQKIGRRLREEEMVHHINGDKSDNRPENLEIVQDSAHHHLLHRLPDCDLRLPDEDNPMIECACGCGLSFLKYDEVGRPRFAIYGHHMPAPTKNVIMAALEDGPKSLRQLTALHGNYPAVRESVRRLMLSGQVMRVGSGIYEKQRKELEAYKAGRR